MNQPTVESLSAELAELREEYRVMDVNCAAADSEVRQLHEALGWLRKANDSLYAQGEKMYAQELATSAKLSELLAVIHRDGGHYQAQHGRDKAYADALVLLAALHVERENEGSPSSTNHEEVSHEVPQRERVVPVCPEALHQSSPDQAS